MASRYTLTATDRMAINQTAARLGIKPTDLAAIIYYETKGTMNPGIVGGKGNDYKGLIQFGEEERRTYGYKNGMSFADQVNGPVYNYLKGRGLPPGASLQTIYRTINGGNPNASLTKNDGGGTILQHVQRIKSDALPQATALLNQPNVNVDMPLPRMRPATTPTMVAGNVPMVGMPQPNTAEALEAQATFSDRFGPTPPAVPNPRMRPNRDNFVAQSGTVTVNKGDSLWEIAKRELGDGRRYREIAEANNIPNPRMIQPGMVLTIPGKAPTPDRSVPPPIPDFLRPQPAGEYADGAMRVAPPVGGWPQPAKPTFMGPPVMPDYSAPPPVPDFLLPQEQVTYRDAPPELREPGLPQLLSSPAIDAAYADRSRAMDWVPGATRRGTAIPPPQTGTIELDFMTQAERDAARLRQAAFTDPTRGQDLLPPRPNFENANGPYFDWTGPGPTLMRESRTKDDLTPAAPAPYLPPPTTGAQLPEPYRVGAIMPSMPNTTSTYTYENPVKIDWRNPNTPPMPNTTSTSGIWNRMNDAIQAPNTNDIIDLPSYLPSYLQRELDWRNSPPMIGYGSSDELIGAGEPVGNWTANGPVAKARTLSSIPTPTNTAGYDNSLNDTYMPDYVAPTFNDDPYAAAYGGLPGIVGTTKSDEDVSGPAPGTVPASGRPLSWDPRTWAPAVPAQYIAPAGAPATTSIIPARPNLPGVPGIFQRVVSPQGGIFGGIQRLLGRNPATFTPSGAGGTAPYGINGTTNWNRGTTNALGGTNALQWNSSGGQTVTVVQDPLSGTYYGPTYS